VWGESLSGPPAWAVLLLDSSDPAQVVEAFSHGARGAFCKSEDLPTLCECVRSVHAGQVWADSVQMQWVLQALQKKEMIDIVTPPALFRQSQACIRGTT